MLILTFGWARAITLWPFVIFKNKSVSVNPTTLSHEAIHCMQQIEILFVAVLIYLFIGIFAGLWTWTLFILLLFYVLYFVEWLIKMIKYGSSLAYENISFEKEAYDNSNITEYWKQRPVFGWIKYLVL